MTLWSFFLFMIGCITAAATLAIVELVRRTNRLRNDINAFCQPRLLRRGPQYVEWMIAALSVFLCANIIPDLILSAHDHRQPSVAYTFLPFLLIGACLMYWGLDHESGPIGLRRVDRRVREVLNRQPSTTNRPTGQRSPSAPVATTPWSLPLLCIWVGFKIEDDTARLYVSFLNTLTPAQTNAVHDFRVAAAFTSQDGSDAETFVVNLDGNSASRREIIDEIRRFLSSKFPDYQIGVTPPKFVDEWRAAPQQ